MKKFDYHEAKMVVVCGDIHGDFRSLVFKLCLQYSLIDTLLIVAGDCGFGFDKPAYYVTVYNQIARLLRKANNWVVFVRGNHDDPSYFAEQRINYARWRTVPDYSVIQAAGHNILCIGGAISVDRVQRMKYDARSNFKSIATYWRDEAPLFRPEEIESIPSEIQIDTVVSHTAPSRCELCSHDGLQSWAEWDPYLLKDIADERATMDQIEQCIRDHRHPVRDWFYGHFHQSWTATLEGIKFSMLDIMEFKEILRQ